VCRPKRAYLTLSTGSDAEASGVGGARPPTWRQLAVSYSFLRHLGKENVAKNAKGQQMLRTKAVSYTLLDQFMTESRFSGDHCNPSAILSFAGFRVENVIMRSSGKCDDLTLNL